MRITRWGEYGLHCAMYIAAKANEGVAAVGAAEIASRQNIDVQYVQQILQRLKKGKVVETIRGRNGGYRLARLAEQITVKDVLLAADGETFEIICDNNPISPSRCGDSLQCEVKPIWTMLRAHIDEFLDQYSIADLLSGKLRTDVPIQIGANKKQFINNHQ